jgi:AcrR family transcriptional regulator
MTTTETTPAQSRIEQKRRREIMRATAEIVAEEGFEGATMRKIAERAGVSPGMLNYYYGTKRDLVLETMNDARNRMLEAIDPLSEAKSGLKRIDAFFRREVGETNTLPMPMRFWLAYWSAAVHNEDLREQLKSSNSPVDAVLESALRAGVASGEVRGDVNPAVARDLLRLVKQGVRAEIALSSTEEKRIAAAVRLLLKLLAA